MSFEKGLEFYRIGKYRDSIDVLDQSKLDDKMLLSKCYRELSQTHKAAELAESCLTEAKNLNDPLTIFKAKTTFGGSIGFYGNSDWLRSMEILKEAKADYDQFSVAEKEQITDWYTDLIFEIGALEACHAGNTNQSTETLNKAAELYNEVGDYRGLAHINNFICFNLFRTDDPSKAINFLEKSIEISETHNIQNTLAFSHIMKGLMSLFSGKIEDAMDYFSRCLNISNEIDNNFVTGHCYLFLGLANLFQGNMNESVEMYEKSLEIGRIIGDRHIEAGALSLMSEVYRKSGELGKCRELLTNSFEIYDIIKDVHCTLDLNLRAGRVYSLSGNLEKAFAHYQISYNRREWDTEKNLPKNTWYFVDAAFQLIIGSIELGKMELAAEVLGVIKKFSNSSPNPRNQLQTRIAEAILLKNSPRIKNKVLAQNSLEMIIDEEIIDDDLTILAILNYCEMLISELQAYGEKEVLEELVIRVDQLYSHAENLKLIPLKIEIDLLKSNLFLVQGKVPVALELLDNALVIVKKKNLNQLITKIETQQKFIESQIEQWDDTIKSEASIVDRINQTNLKTYIANVLKLRAAEVS
ncbi:MAG: tetratricopeptide repeat protein [Candidatus Kariarchaeaceae archaeon]